MKPYTLTTTCLLISALIIGCAPKTPQTNTDDTAVEQMTAGLKTIQDDYLPQSISDTGTVVSAKVSSKEEDICAGLDFMECQPRLIRAYLLFGQGAIALTHQVVTSVARDLSKAPDNSTGVVQIPDKNLTIEYKKRSLLDYDFLISQGAVPVGRVSANPSLYTIQFDLGVLDKNNPDSRGGKIDIQVNYTSQDQWDSQITVSDQKCNTEKPDDPESGRIIVHRHGGLWNGQSMFYNGIAAAFNTVKSCSTASSDATGLVVYTDFVADRVAAKAALYVMKRTEQSTSQIQNFGFNNFCENYPDLCQSLATAIGATPEALDTHLNQLTNPYCVHRGSPDVAWNSACQDLSSNVSNEPLQANSDWMSPFDFYQMRVQIPSHL